MTPTPVAAPEAGSHPTQRTSSPATERRGPVALLALTAVVAAHVVDDSFLQPPAGTAAADHLVSGLVLLAVLAVAAAICLRVRPGAAGATAVGTGVLGVTVGAIEAGYSTATSGPSGDDVTGLLAAAAGLGLVGIGTLQLWRSRRGGGRVRRYGRRVLKTAAALVAVQVVFYPVGFSYVSTHVARAHVPAADLGAAYEDVTLRTSDGLDLQGWYVPSRNGAAVLAFPGRLGPQAHARMLARHGYGVLLLDRRGEGASEGAPNMFGWDGERDVHAAVAFLRRTGGRRRVRASAVSACPWAARCCCTLPPRDDAVWRPWCRRAPARGPWPRSRSRSIGGRSGRCPPSSPSSRPRSWCCPVRRRPTAWSTWSRGSPHGRSS